MRKNDFEVIVIGGGVLGCFAAREMTRQGLGVCVLEKNADICAGITKANTAVIYPGYDTLPGSLKTRFGVKASREMAELCAELSVPFRRCGSLFTACGPVSEGIVRERYELGTANGVEGLEILSGDEARRLEPNLSPAVTSALFAPTAGTLDPWAFGIAAAENAAANGAVFVTGERARGVAYDAAAGVYSITAPASGTTYTARAVINAAGLYTDEVFASYGAPGFCIVPSKNEYIVLDTYAAEAVNGIVFQERESGKGVTIVPTVGGNVLVAGTDLGGTIAKTDTATTAAGQRHIEELAREILPALPLDTKIRSFAGVRPGIYPVAAGGWPHPDKTRTVNEFTILEDEDSPCLITFAGIKTPGLTCAREIGAYAAELVCRRLGRIAGQAAAGFDPRRRVNLAGRAAAAPGGTGETIVCRCRGVTEGAVRAAARSMAGAVNVNGVKRRTEAGLGRCQGGYCLQNIIEILADELGVPAADIKLEEDDAAIVYGGQGGEAPPRAVPRDSLRGGYGEYADVAILGSGPAGLSAAVAAKECGARRVLILERLSEPGGLLPQCVHRGFGARIFGGELTGPEYAARLISAARTAGAEFLTDCAVTAVRLAGGGGPLALSVRSRSFGDGTVHAGALVFAAGCRERPLGHLPVTGERPAGIFTAGAAQRLMNIGHYTIGKRAVLLGSGDVGLIMARQMKLAGMEVVCAIEQSESCGGLPRNRRECLDGFGIPLLTGQTISRVFGRGRIEAVEAVSVRGAAKPEFIECDTLIVSVCLIPERDLLYGLPESGNIILCGNAKKILTLADDIADDGARAGREAALRVTNRGAAGHGDLQYK